MATLTESPVDPAQIAALPLFSSLSPEHVAILASCAVPVVLDEGAFAGRQGEPADSFYSVSSGRLAMQIMSPEGDLKTIQTIGPDEVLGWSWIFPPHLWHFDAVALEPTTALRFDGVKLREACERDHDLGYALVTRFAQIVVQRLLAASLHLIAD